MTSVILSTPTVAVATNSPSIVPADLPPPPPYPAPFPANLPPELARYARMGAALYPIEAGTKDRYLLGSWAHEWSKDPAVWSEWAARWPGCGWIMVAGPSGKIIVDIDVKKGREVAWAAWCDWCVSRGLPVYPAHVDTPSSGMHIYFDTTETDLGQPGLVMGLIDIRAGNGYVLIPPSQIDGKPYAWKGLSAPHAAPPDLVKHCKPKPRRQVGPGMGDFDYTDMEARCTFLAENDGYLADEFNWVKSIWALRQAFGDRAWPLAQIVSYRDHKNRLESVWEREDSNNENPSTCATLIDESNKAGYREHKREHLFDGVAQLVRVQSGEAPLVPEHKPVQGAPAMPKQLTADELAKDRAAALDAAALPLIFFDEALNAPLQKQIIKGVISEGTTSTVFAMPKRMKSTIITDMGVHLGSAAQWRGHRIPEKRGTVFFAFERALQVREALKAYKIRDGLENIPFAIVPKLVNMLDPACVDLIKHAVDRAEQRWGIACGLTVFDTWNKGIAAGGGNEDKAEHQNIAAANLRRLLEQMPVLHCMTIGHTGKDVGKGERGSNATEGDRDTGFKIIGEKDKYAMEVAYSNVLAPGEVITTFEGELVEIGKDEDGEPVKSFIVSRQPVAMPAGKAAARNLTDNEGLALQALGDVLKIKGQWGGEIGGRNVTLDEWKDQCIRAGAVAQDKNTFRDLGRRQVGLIAKGRIIVLDNRVRLAGGAGLPTGNVIPMVPTLPGNAVPMPPGTASFPIPKRPA